MRINRNLILLHNVFVILFCAVFCVGQDTSNLKDKKITINMKKESVRNVFNKLINDYDIAIGFEESLLDENHDDYDFVYNTRVTEEEVKSSSIPYFEQTYLTRDHLIDLEYDNTNLENVLNSIVSQMGNYKWEINDEVVNIFPVKSQNNKLRVLLDSKISSFKIPGNSNYQSIARYLRSLPEFRAFLEENNLTARTYLTDVSFTLNRKLNKEINFTNITFRDLLNKLSAIKRGGWILKYRKNDKDNTYYIIINI